MRLFSLTRTQELFITAIASVAAAAVQLLPYAYAQTTSTNPAAVDITIAANPAIAQASATATGQPVTLYGRIEQLNSHSGAQLPPGIMRRQTGKIDQAITPPPHATYPGYATTYYGSSTTPPPAAAHASQAGFPSTFLGSWQGTLRVHSNQFDPVSLQVDRDETLKEQELLAPGKDGNVVFTFTRSGNGQLYLEPSQVVFSAPMSQSRHADEFMGLLQNMPYYYGLEMGDVSQGVGVTGNALHNRVVKNDVKQLAARVVEQDLVNYNQERNPQTGRTQNGYSEIVLRFYQQSAQQLYVQVASVNYLADGRFKDKIFLYGTVQRTDNPAPRQFPTQLPMQLPIQQMQQMPVPPELQDMVKQMTNQFSSP